MSTAALPSKLSIVIPVYNGAATIAELVRQLSLYLPTVASTYEIILINDGSRDGSREVLAQLAETDPRVLSLDLMRNYGQHNALLCGIRAARQPVVVTMDDDLQHPPEELVHLLRHLSHGFDVVYGTPVSQQHGLLRGIASRLTKAVLQGAMGADTATKVSAWRALRREVCAGFESYQNTFVSIDVLLTWGTTRFSSVTVRHEPRSIGQSNYTVGALLRHALNMLTGFSTLPLQLASFVGFFFTLFGIGVLLYVLIRYFVSGGSIPGFPFLASIIALFSGAQLFALGIIGEYLARMHSRSMDRPAYVVRHSTGERPDAP